MEWTPARIRQFRETALCLSQDEFATTLGFAKRTVGNAERGTHPPSLALRRALDRALEQASDLQTDRFYATVVTAQAGTQAIRELGDSAQHSSPTLDGLRRVVLGRPLVPMDISTRVAPQAAGAAATAMAATTQVHRLYQLGEYDAAAQLLPAVLMRLQGQLGTNENSDGRRVSTLMTAGAYIAVAKLATKLGDSSLASVSADRAITAANENEHAALAGIATYQVGCALLLTGDLMNAERVINIGVDNIAGVATTINPDRNRDGLLSVYGCLVLLVAIIAARRDDRRAAQTALHKAGQLAERLGRDDNLYWTAFGPTNVAIHQLSVHTRLGNTQRATQLGVAINTNGLPSVLRGRRAQVHLELSWAAAKQSDDGLAVLHLLEAERVAQQAVSRNSSTRQLISTLVKRERVGVTPGLRGLAERSGLFQ